MNIQELIEQLKKYPSNTPVITGVKEGNAFIANSVQHITSQNGLSLILIGHESSEDWLEDDIISLL